VAVPDGRGKGGDSGSCSSPGEPHRHYCSHGRVGSVSLDGVRAHRGSLLIDNPGSWRTLVRDISLEEPFQAEVWVCGKLTREGKPDIQQRIDLDAGKPGDSIKAVCLAARPGSIASTSAGWGTIKCRPG